MRHSHATTTLQGPGRRGDRRRVLAPAVLTAAAALATLVVLFAVPGPARPAPGDVAWSDFHQRVAGGADAYTALAVTPAGGAYAVGYTTPAAGAEANVLIRKYSLGGKVLWRRAWTYPGRISDRALAAVRDRKGNLVVAGASGNAFLVLKYRSDGYLLWVRRARAPYAACGLSDVTVDPGGNVYAAGQARPAGEAERSFVIKYSAAGLFRWRATLPAPAGAARATAITLDGERNVYVTGSYAAEPGVVACVTAKYSMGGKRRWVTLSAGPEGHAEGTRLAVRGGTVYVIGERAGGDDPPSGFLATYTADGAERWVTGSAGAAMPGDVFSDVVVEADGSSYVAGWRQTAAGGELTTTRFTPEGAADWVAVHGAGTSAAAAVCRDGRGRIVTVAGLGGDRLGAASQSLDGVPNWFTEFSAGGRSVFAPSAAAVVVDKAVFAVGRVDAAGGGSAAFIIRFQP